MSNLGNIGDQPKSKKEFAEVVKIWLQEGKQIKFEGGSYIVYESGNGIEI